MYEILSSYIFKWRHLMFEMYRTCRRFDQTPCFANCTFQTRESPQNRVHASWPILKCNVCFQLSRGLIGILKRQCSCRKRLLSARRGYFVPGRTMVENKVQDGPFAAIEDITIIPSILGYSTPHSRVLQKTHKNYDLSVQGVKKRLQLHHAHRPIQQWCLSSQSNEVSNVGWSSLYKKCLEFRHCLLFNCIAVTANIYTIAMSCPGMISCIMWITCTFICLIPLMPSYILNYPISFF